MFGKKGGANTSYFQDKGVYYLNYMLDYTASQARRTSKASHVLLDDRVVGCGEKGFFPLWQTVALCLWFCYGTQEQA